MSESEIEETEPEEIDVVMDSAVMRIATWDETNAMVNRSVHAYLMYHSGALFRKSITESDERTFELDEAAEEAVEKAADMGYDMSDNRRLRSMLSLRTQTQHETGEVPVCYLDVELIKHTVILPSALASTTHELWQDIELEPIKMGFPRFNTFSDLKQAYEQLAYCIQYYPSEVDYALSTNQEDYLRISDYSFNQEVASFHFTPPEYHIIGVPCERDRSLGQLDMAHDIGKLITIKGQIIEISEAKTSYEVIAFKCKDRYCNEVHFIEQDSSSNSVTKPEPSCGKYAEMMTGESNSCKSRHFIRLPPPMSQAVSLQRITLQEEELTHGEAKTIVVEVRGSMVEKMVAGQGVEIVGILSTEPLTRGALLENKFLLAKSVTERTDIFSQINISKEDRSEIETWRAENPLSKRLQDITDSWAGRVHSEDHIKKAIVLQSCGGSYNSYSETRGTFHILIVGDPGTAKSKLLELATKLHPGSRFVQADAATQAGLTAACAQVEDVYTGKKKWALVPGALALAHPDAICSIDEFNLYKGNFGDFNNAMESGYVYVDKVVKGKVKTLASVLAGANPNNGNKKKWMLGVSWAEQIGLDFTMLQRFAIIFIIKDRANKERDKNIALSMMKGVSVEYQKEIHEEELSIEFIQKYLAVAREYDPRLSKEVETYIANKHASRRASNDVNDTDSLISHRQVNAIWRLTTAIARFDLCDVATMEHVRCAEDILQHSLAEMDPLAAEGGQSKEDVEHDKKLSETMKTILVEGARENSMIAFAGMEKRDLYRKLNEDLENQIGDDYLDKLLHVMRVDQEVIVDGSLISINKAKLKEVEENGEE